LDLTNRALHIPISLRAAPHRHLESINHGIERRQQALLRDDGSKNSELKPDWKAIATEAGISLPGNA
jgi:hypothetical protein